MGGGKTSFRSFLHRALGREPDIDLLHVGKKTLLSGWSKVIRRKKAPEVVVHHRAGSVERLKDAARMGDVEWRDFFRKVL